MGDSDKPFLKIPIRKVGLKKYLNETREEHNGQGYDEFVFFTTTLVHNNGTPDRSSIAKAFGVHRKTIYKWLDIYTKELKE